MDLRDRLGLYGSYFFGMCGIGFTLPYLSLYLALDKGMSDRAIGIVSTLAALAGLAQFPAGLWSDRLGRRKPFLVAALAAVAAATWLLPAAHGPIWVGLLVVLFAENGVGRAVVESLAGAEAAALAPPGGVGSALGRLRFWKPTGVVVVALLGGLLVRRGGASSVLVPLAVVQTLAVGLALLLPGDRRKRDAAGAGGDGDGEGRGESGPAPGAARRRLRDDRGLWAFVAAMALFHAANSPGGVYLSLYLERELHAPRQYPSYAFAVSMVAWMLVVGPAGRLADRWGRKPLLIAGWGVMALRLALVAAIRSPALIVANQVLDGLGSGLFAVLAAAWVTDRLADPTRAGEAQVIVGSSLVLGSGIGPGVAGLVVDSLGYRGLFLALAGVGVVATAIVVFLVPETLDRSSRPAGTPLNTPSDLSTSP